MAKPLSWKKSFENAREASEGRSRLGETNLRIRTSEIDGFAEWGPPYRMRENYVWVGMRQTHDYLYNWYGRPEGEAFAVGCSFQDSSIDPEGKNRDRYYLTVGLKGWSAL